MAISAKNVMNLRKRTGVGMMECKAALDEANGDMDIAVKLLREKLKGDMEERADRAASEGVIAIASNKTSVSIIELVSETDFAARNESFVGASEQIAALALNDVDGPQLPSSAINEIVDDLRITIKENISVGRMYKLSGPTQGSYLHHNRQLGAVVVGEGEFSDELLTGLCQHLVAAVPPMMPAPMAVDQAGLPAEVIEQKRDTFAEEARNSGKPDEIITKMVTGKLNKWIAEHTLLGQTYIRELDAKKPVGDYLSAGAVIKSFVRLQVGGE